MKGPKDSKESHTSVTMEGMAGAGMGWGGGRSLLSVRGTGADELLSGTCEQSPLHSCVRSQGGGG